MRLLIVLLAISWSQQLKAAENHIAPIVADLSIIARLINGIALQSDFMRSSQNMNPVLAELLNIGDPNAIPELVKIKVSTLSADVQGLLEAVKNLPASTLRQINPDAVKMLRRIDVATIDRALQVSTSDLRWKWLNARNLADVLVSEEFILAVTNLKYVMKAGGELGSVEMWDNMKSLTNYTNHITNLFRELRNRNLDPFESLNGTKELLKDFASSAQSVREYEKFLDSLQTLVQAISDAKTLATELDPIIKKSQTISIDNKTLEAVKTAFSTPNDKNLAAGLPNGGSDLKTLFDDLNGKWLKDQFKGKDMKMLVTALEPLKKFYETLKPVEDSWNELKKFPETQQVVESVTSLLQYGKLLKPENLTAQANASSQCTPPTFPTGAADNLEKFETFYQGLDYFDAQLSPFKSALEPVKASPISAKVEAYNWDSLALPVGVGEEEMKNITNQLRSNADFVEIADFLIALADALKKIDLAEIKRMLSFYDSSSDVQRTFLGIGLPGFIGCLNTSNFDFDATETFARFDQNWRVLKSQSNAEEAFKSLTTAIEKLTSTEKNLKKVVDGMKTGSRRRRRSASGPGAKGLWKLENSNELARNLGNGVQALREMSEVFVHQDRVKQVARSSAEVDRVIRSIPKMNAMWTVENKTALENLVNEVNSLNQKAGLEKNRSLEKTWKLFGEAQIVHGAPVDSRLLVNLVYGVLEKHNKAEVKTGAVAFKDFPPLQLNFASGKRNSLRASFSMLNTLTAFFDGFFPRPTSAPTLISTVEPSTSSSFPVYIGIGGAVLFLLILLAGFFAFRFYRNHKLWKNRERFWIYDTLKHDDAEKNFWKHIIKEENKEVKTMVKAGKIVNYYLEMQTPLHLAVDVLATDLVEYLIRHGANTKAESYLHETAEQMTDRMLKKEKLKPSWPELEKISKIFKKYKNKKFKPTIPELFPYTLFSVVSTNPQNPVMLAFLEKYLNKSIKPAAHYTTCTHIVVEVDEQGVYHYQGTSHEDLMTFYYVFFGKQIVVSPKWLELCLKDERNFYKDYECRVTQVEFDGKVYSTLDKVKEFARGRHLPFGTGIHINNFTRLRKNLNEGEESIMDLIKNWGFAYKERFKDPRWDYLPLEPKPEFTKPYYRPDLKANWIVYDDENLDNCEHEVAGTKLDDFHIMSYREFTGYLLDMKMTNGNNVTQFPIKETKTTKATVSNSKTNSAPTPTSVASTKPSTTSNNPKK